MGNRARPLTAAETETARRMRDAHTPQRAGGSGRKGRRYYHMDPRRIAQIMGVSERAVRRALGLEKDSHKLSERIPDFTPKSVHVPPDVWADRDRRLAELEYRSSGAVALGDPPFSQSALGKRNGAQGQETQNGATREEWPTIERAGGRSKFDRQADAASQWQRFLSRSVSDNSPG